MDITFLVWAALIATVAFSGVALWETQNITAEIFSIWSICTELQHRSVYRGNNY